MLFSRSNIQWLIWNFPQSTLSGLFKNRWNKHLLACKSPSVNLLHQNNCWTQIRNGETWYDRLCHQKCAICRLSCWRNYGCCCLHSMLAQICLRRNYYRWVILSLEINFCTFVNMSYFNEIIYLIFNLIEKIDETLYYLSYSSLCYPPINGLTYLHDRFIKMLLM